MFERIVVTVDGSDPAKRALPFAADLASKYGSEVIVILVFEEDETILREPSSLMPPPGALDIADRAARLLKDVGVSARADRRVACVHRQRSGPRACSDRSSSESASRGS